MRAGGNALAKVGKAPSVERGPVRFGGKTDGAGPPSVSDRPWSVEDNRTALRKLDELKRELADAPASQWADIEAEMGAIRKQLGIESAYNAPTSTAPNPRMGALPADDPFGDRAWAAQKKGLPPPQAETPAIDTRAWTPQDFAAARTQLREDIAYRKTAPASEHADLDEQIAALRNALGATDGPPISEGVIMDAKDPGRGMPAKRPPPAQAGFSGSKPGGKGPPNALAPKKPAPVLSRAAEEATRELKAARRAYNTAANKWVMKDDRELRVKPLEDRVVAAEAKLAQVLKNDARLKTIAARGHALMRSDDLRVPLGLAAAGTGVLTAGVLGYNALAPKKAAEAPMSAKDPRFYWSTIQNNEDAMARIQMALGQWDEWPEDAEMTGAYGKVTKQALKSWRFARGLDPDAPMTQKDVERLLAGPKGYQDRDGKAWRYGADGERVSAP